MNNEYECFGCTLAELDRAWDERPEWMTPISVAISLLSDSQEQIADWKCETARQTINKVKYILTTKIK